MKGDFFKGADEFLSARAAASEQAYGSKMLRALLEAVYGRVSEREMEREARDEFGFMWFNDTFSCPIFLRVSKVAVAPVHLIKGAGMTKTALWTAYFDIKAEYPMDRAVGMIFRIPNVGHFVMHNYTALPPEPGYNTVVRQAINVDKALFITPWPAFLAGLQKVWSV